MVSRSASGLLCQNVPHINNLVRRSTINYRRTVASKAPLPSDFAAVDERNRTTTFWTPTRGSEGATTEKDGFSLLSRAGFIRQAHSGIFHLLPLGLRVQTKLEQLIDKHMRKLGACKLSLSSITTEMLWRESGRIDAALEDGQHEFLSVKDRRTSGFLLSPTHEEEITSLASSFVHSYKELPLRLYQISRKYRDELRPRQGLLRAKEFVMKDLYTFDYTKEAAMATYNEVRRAYDRIIQDLGVRFLVAEADSGNMGGKLSHEYHFVSDQGEDTVYQCNLCTYAANEEVVAKRTAPSHAEIHPIAQWVTWRGISKDRRTVVHAHFPDIKHPDRSSATASVDMRLIKEIYPGLDTSVDGLINFSPLDNSASVHLIDFRLKRQISDTAFFQPHDTADASVPTIIWTHPTTQQPLDLVRLSTGSPCPRCETGTLTEHRCIEIGHTFHLGTRYSEPLKAAVTVANADGAESVSAQGQQRVHLQMGCHGIGVSRLLGAIALLMADQSGLRWPPRIAPFDAVIVPMRGFEADADRIYDMLTRELGLDMLIDDRDKSLSWKLKDADLIGYSLTLVLGRAWKSDRSIEVQCRIKPKLEVFAGEDALVGACRTILETLDK